MAVHCSECETDIQVVKGNRGWMMVCECENDEGIKAAPVPYQGDPQDAHESWGGSDE